MSELLNAALSYAAKGWPVLPLDGKIPRLPDGSKGATTDPETIRRWWSRWPSANVGIATGGAGPWVLDLDAGGEEAWGPLGDHPRVRTASGLHLYFAPDPEVRNRQKPGGMPWDVRGAGGYVVAPPSRHPSGAIYAWEREGQPVAPAAEEREWALWGPSGPPKPPALPRSTPAPVAGPGEVPGRRQWGQAMIARACARIRDAGEGGRHRALLRESHACGGHEATLAAEGLAEWARAELIAAGVAAGKPEREVRRAVGDGWARGAASPLDPPDWEAGRGARVEGSGRAVEPPAWLDDGPGPAEPAGPVPGPQRATVGGSGPATPPPLPPSRPAPVRRPDIVVSGRDMWEVVGDAQRALSRGPARLYSRDGELVTLSGSAEAPYIAPVGGAEVTAALLASARLVKVRPPKRGEASEGEGADGQVWITEPADRVPAYLVPALQGSARGGAWLPELRRVALAPYWRPGAAPGGGHAGTVGAVGTVGPPELVAQPGLHVADATWLAQGRPSGGRMQLAEAVGLLREWLAGFPFDGAADYAHTLALLLTPQVRGLISGPVPMTVIEAPTPGTGKSLLAEVVAHVAGGAPAVASPLATQEEERRKALVTLFAQGLPVVWLDNVDRRLDDAVLALAVTTGRVQDRQLGTQRVVAIETRASIVVTANNLELTRDIQRRSVIVRLDSGAARPEERTGFAISDLRGWTGARLSQLREATYAMVEAWIAQGCPAPAHGRSRGSFEAWARVVGGVLDVAGIEGFLDTRTALADEDPGEIEWAALLVAMGKAPHLAVELVGLADREGVLGWATGDGTDRSRATKLAGHLRRLKGRVWKLPGGGRRKLDTVMRPQAKTPAWVAIDPDAGEQAGQVLHWPGQTTDPE